MLEKLNNDITSAVGGTSILLGSSLVFGFTAFSVAGTDISTVLGQFIGFQLTIPFLLFVGGVVGLVALCDCAWSAMHMIQQFMLMVSVLVVTIHQWVPSVQELLASSVVLQGVTTLLVASMAMVPTLGDFLFDGY